MNSDENHLAAREEAVQLSDEATSQLKGLLSRQQGPTRSNILELGKTTLAAATALSEVIIAAESRIARIDNLRR